MKTKKKKILFVINTMGGAGAETALIEMLELIDKNKFSVYLYVLLEQGELIGRVPAYVKLLNRRYSPLDVWTPKGRRKMYSTVLKRTVSGIAAIRRLPYLARNFGDMLSKRRIQADKLMWKIVSDGAPTIKERFDLAVAFIEGGSAYYVAERVNAAKKAAFIHIDYKMAGYTPKLDTGCYDSFDRIFAISDEVKDAFLDVYPVYEKKTFVLHNIINVRKIRERSLKNTGFSDGYDGFRILTVGRLTVQKSYETAIETMYLLKKSGFRARWYVLGEGDRRRQLERRIAELGLENDFILVGAVSNPFPYYRQADLYVHATRYEGKSIAIQEAQVLGCAVLASDRGGNREQINDGVDGWLCELLPEALADKIIRIAQDPQETERCKNAVRLKNFDKENSMYQLLELL